MSQVIGRIPPNTPRRVMAAGFLGVLGGMVLYLAARYPPPEVVGLVFLVLFGIGSLILSARLWRATGRTLELTEQELREDDGTVLCRIEDVASVDSGMFAFKPAGGFAVRLKSRAPGAWAPGLWWRAGRKLMIGGATSRAEARAVADVMKVMLARRDGA